MSDKRAFEALKPCPFCGCDVEVEQQFTDGPPRAPDGYQEQLPCGWLITCGCAANPNVYDATLEDEGRRAVIETWNSRAPLAAAGREGQPVAFVRDWFADNGTRLGWRLEIGMKFPVDSAYAGMPLYTHPAPKADAAADWVCVPREPTEAMLRAGHAAYMHGEGGEGGHGGYELDRQLYRAMIQASPARVGEGEKDA